MRISAIALLLVFYSAGPVAAQTTSATPPVPGCETSESRQLDFWVGAWEVRPSGADNVVAHSLIEKRYAGCAIRENWMPLGQETTGGGGSLSLYDTRTREWHQTWVDSTGTRVDFDGGMSNGIMTITGNWPNFAGPGADALVRMHYQKQPNGEVRQWAEASDDHGKSWKAAFDLLYRRVDKLPGF